MKKQHYLLQFFITADLPDEVMDEVMAASKPFYQLAKKIDKSLPDNPEKSTALRKLMEAKDCAVRAVLFQGD